MKKSIVIIGGSIAGLSAALFFAAAKNDELDFALTVFDEKKGDLNAAAIYNVPFFPRGAKADEIYAHIKGQISSMLEVKYIDSAVVEIQGRKGDFTIVDSEGLKVKSDYIIVATGASKCNIKGLEDFIRPHTLMPKEGKIRLECYGRQMIKDGIYAAGLVSGVTTMVACAMGSANESACAILSDIKGTLSVHHDTPSSRS
ncbi:FAD-dependent oxidoreductase [Campylobacter sp. MIT 21-1685]|uniref:FAD-dependent oxidoreductase n=1 Tax=unclassified Campylobacter TaxID=2593542 RepID=UPI00224AB967|nr:MULTISPECIES: FAD-dependent oxidoreductase [unclassified Campylobacter]MCX2683608.1 FAD-dependent oxidoreductase [Campylobacter sp. MIT 21-1684]MCX2751891.1 FAD-dependent oxidoreductase [Campylobacter sp. MIT 21-1682]MCX2808092.1 FAD-dependent oxidoreductase [Campylobacter sp. MIT 21-1685]